MLTKEEVKKIVSLPDDEFMAFISIIIQDLKEKEGARPHPPREGDTGAPTGIIPIPNLGIMDL